MAVHVYTNAFLDLNSVNQDDHITEIRLPMQIEKLEAQTMGDTVKLHEPGLRSFSMEVVYRSDFADAEIDEALYSLWLARTKFPVEFRPDAAAASATNPSFTFSAFIEDFGGLGGAHGTLGGGSLTLANTTDITRAEA